MNIPFLKNPTAKFLVFIFLFYISWYFIYNWWIHPLETIDLAVIDFTVSISKWILELLNYKVFVGSDRLFGIDGTGGLWVGDSCNAMALFALFTGFIVAYKGNWNVKVIYILSGIICIELLNVLRLVALAIMETYSYTWTEFNHAYTFTIIIYGFIFWLWILWVNKFSKKGIK